MQVIHSISSAISQQVYIEFVAPVNQKLHVEKVENHEVTPLTKLPRLTLATNLRTGSSCCENTNLRTGLDQWTRQSMARGHGL